MKLDLNGFYISTPEKISDVLNAKVTEEILSYVILKFYAYGYVYYIIKNIIVTENKGLTIENINFNPMVYLDASSEDTKTNT